MPDPVTTSRRPIARGARIVARVFLALALATAAGGAVATATGEGTTAYIKLHPDFLVNLESRDGTPHYLHATIQVRSNDPTVLEKTWHHVAAIRHELLLHLGEEKFEGIDSPETRARLQEESLEIVNRVLADLAGIKVDGLFFTHYLID